MTSPDLSRSVDPLLAQAFADRYEPQIRESILSAIRILAEAIPPLELEAALRSPTPDALNRLIAFTLGSSIAVSTTAAPITTALSAPFAGSYLTTLTAVPAITAATSLTLTNPAALRWIAQRAAALVTNITEDTRTAIRSTILQGFIEGIGAPATGRLIRSQIGLLPAHSIALRNYAETLLARSMSPSARDNLIETYARRLRNYRAETIARTESMTAAVAGQYLAWTEQMIDGTLDSTRTWVEWMVTEDDRLCPLCAPLDGLRIPFGRYFTATHRGYPEDISRPSTPGSRRRRQSPLRPSMYDQPRDPLGRFTVLKADGSPDLTTLRPLRSPITVLHPPLHPNCRCVLVLRFTPPTPAPTNQEAAPS